MGDAKAAGKGPAEPSSPSLDPQAAAAASAQNAASSSSLSSSGLTFKLHPLVVVNISDHYTRIRAQQRGTPSRVIGCVLGVQSGRTVEIFNSFELKFHDAVSAVMEGKASSSGGASSSGAGTSDAQGSAMGGAAVAGIPLLDEGEPIIDREFLDTKIEQYKKVFPSYDVLGWYSTGTEIHAADMLIHKALMEINESPIYVLLNPTINPAAKDLPVTVYESELHVIDGHPSLIFVSSTYTIETVEAERISVDHVAHIKPSDGSSTTTQLAAHLTGMHNAVKMLSSRIQALHNLLLAMQRGEQPYCHSLFRQASSVLRRLPAVDSPAFLQEYLTEHNDTLLTTYMASTTKGINTTNELVEKFNIAFDKQGKRPTLAAFV